VLTVGELHYYTHKISADEPVFKEDDVEISIPVIASVELNDCKL
jgi:hypothetical protein